MNRWLVTEEGYLGKLTRLRTQKIQVYMDHQPQLKIWRSRRQIALLESRINGEIRVSGNAIDQVRADVAVIQSTIRGFTSA
jgi:hypothetical protein